MARTPKLETASINDSLRRKEAAAAKLKELEFDKAAGKVVDSELAAKAVVHILSVVRGRLLGLPTKITPFLVLATDAATVKSILDEEITLILTEMTADTGPLSANAIRRGVLK
ncbi:MAG: hypothetical protein ABSC22_05640 [Roseiarcus sp.]